MTKPKISDLLGITDDVMFQNVMKDPINCKMLLHEILPDIEIEDLSVHSQERFKLNKKLKFVIMDIWAKDREGKIYDIEMQVSHEKDLDLRARYYLSKQDETALHSGQHYFELPQTYVIFLCPFDPKGLSFKEYDFTYTCKQAQSLALDTRSEIIYLNSKGTKGKIQPDLQNFLNLMNGETTSDTKFMRRIKTTMDNYRRTPEWREHRMNIEELIDETTIDGIKNAIELLQEYKVTDDKILISLKKKYGDQFSENELKQFIKETK